MKSKIILGSLFLICLFLCSCNSTSNEPSTKNISKNFWERNYLSYIQIRGNVKTITEVNSNNIGDTTVYQFNKDGFVISSLTKRKDGEIIIQTISYNSSNQITKSQTIGTYNSATYTDITSYEYGTHGKYVPGGLEAVSNGLTYNLKAVINETNAPDFVNTRMDFVFNGDNLLIVKTYNNASYNNDTTFVTFSGKYPIMIKNKSNLLSNITYAENGMFKSYNKKLLYGGNENLTNIVTFKTDDDYLLLGSESFNGSIANGIPMSSSYSYNDHKDLIKNSGNSNFDYTYVYDSQGNWINRINPAKYTTKRIIEYWD